jgi:hypothetical protein
MSPEEGIAVVRRNTEEVQSRGNFEVFEELFAADFVDHTPQPGGFTPDRDADRAQDPLRDRRRHARAQRQDHRPLGSRESPVPRAATWLRAFLHGSKISGMLRVDEELNAESTKNERR